MSRHRDRVRAEGFGRHAAGHDRFRPSYPHALVAWLSDRGPGAAVDVGCGTGQVASLLRGAGWLVKGVEPDVRMASVARSHGIDVDIAPFEAWPADRHDYDLVCSGTAWHWVDPDAGYDIAARLLRPGGRLAVFRNTYRYEPPLATAIDDALARLAPHLIDDCIPLGSSSRDLIGGHASEMAAHPDLFVSIERQVFTHERRVTAREWVAELRTHSPIALLNEPVRQQLLAELAGRVGSSARGRLRIRHETPCAVATRR